jgi:hypothetical protein
MEMKTIRSAKDIRNIEVPEFTELKSYLGLTYYYLNDPTAP